MEQKNEHKEDHSTEHIGWLRAAVLGANDGILSVGSLLIGVAAAGGSERALLVAGVAGLVAGAFSMAAGEYVSVSSQSDAEDALIEKETAELKEDYEAERRELAGIYEQRGLTPDLATEDATQLMEHDALEAHSRDELGLSETLRANPLQAAFSSALSFTGGAALPLLVTLVVPGVFSVWAIAGASLVALGVLGYLSAYVGGTNRTKAVTRVVFWGTIAMIVTALIGKVV